MKISDLAKNAAAELETYRTLQDGLRPTLDLASIARTFDSRSLLRLAEPHSAAMAAAMEASRIDKENRRRLFAPLQEVQRFSSAAAAMAETVRQLQVHNNSAWRAASRIMETERLSRALFGPLEDLRRSAELALPDFAKSISKFVERDFRLPALNETAQLAVQGLDSLKVFGEAHDRQLRTLSKTMAGMRSPWLDVRNELGSVRGLQALQEIGHTLRSSMTYDDGAVAALRTNLGDWRDEMVVPPKMIDDLALRTEFYVQRGFNPALTNFPAPAFRESVRIARLDEVSPDLIEIEDYEIPAASAEEEQGFVRTNSAHDRLTRFETQLRRFIDARMSAEFGLNWIKHQVPGDTRKEWIEKQQKSAEKGEASRPLIWFADFTDYERIICRTDNWKRIFEPIFRRPESVRESFQRLYPLRLSVMHARLISQDDELLLFVEVKRILKAIGVLTS
jgi:hypothetical protein